MTIEETQFKLRLPEGVKRLLEREAGKNRRSQNAEVQAALEAWLWPTIEKQEVNAGGAPAALAGLVQKVWPDDKSDHNHEVAYMAAREWAVAHNSQDHPVTFCQSVAEGYAMARSYLDEKKKLPQSCDDFVGMTFAEYCDAAPGRQQWIADALNVSKATVSQWKLERVVPAERCPDIERLSDGLVRCETMRPDVAWDVLRG